MFGPMPPNPIIVSASSVSVKRAAAQERETPKTDSAQGTLQDSRQLPRSPMYLTFSKRTKFSMPRIKT